MLGKDYFILYEDTFSLPRPAANTIATDVSGVGVGGGYSLCEGDG